MDLNHLYSQHQIALMKADAAASLPDRRRYLDSASHIARRIGSYQQAHGAQAGLSWLDARRPGLLPAKILIAEGTSL